VSGHQLRPLTRPAQHVRNALRSHDGVGQPKMTVSGSDEQSRVFCSRANDGNRIGHAGPMTGPACIWLISQVFKVFQGNVCQRPGTPGVGPGLQAGYFNRAAHAQAIASRSNAELIARDQRA